MIFKIILGIGIAIIIALNGILYHQKVLLNHANNEIQNLNNIIQNYETVNAELKDQIKKQNEMINEYVQKNINLMRQIDKSYKDIKTLSKTYEEKIEQLHKETIPYQEVKCENNNIVYKDYSSWMNSKWKELFEK